MKAALQAGPGKGPACGSGGSSDMAKHVKRSVVPIYLVGAVWLAYALLFPLYQPVHYLLCGALSAAAFIVGKGLFPTKVYEVPGEPE